MRGATSAMRGFLLLTAVAWTTMQAAAAHAQSDPLSKAVEGATGGGEAASGAGEPTVDELEAKLIEDAETWQAKTAKFRELRDTAPERLRQIEAELEALRRRPPKAVPYPRSTEQINYELAVAEEELSRLQARAVELEGEPERRTQRRKALPGLIADARARLQALQEPGKGDLDPEAERAEILNLRALERKAIQHEIDAYEAELSSYDARATLLARQRDLANLELSSQNQYLTRLRDALANAQRETVQADARRARSLLEQVDGLPPEVQATVRDLAERNLAFTELWTGDNGLVEKISTVSERLIRARQQVASVQADLTRLTAKVEAAGLAESVGAMLRRERAEAPDLGMYKRFVRMRQDQINEAQLQQLRLQEQREQVADVESRVRETLLAMGDSMNADQRAQVEVLLRELFDNQRRYMDALVADHDEYFRKLVEFDQEQRQLITEGEKLIDFINERVLWVRSGGPMGSELWPELLASVGWLTGERYLAQLGSAVQFGFDRRSLMSVVLILLAGAFAVFLRPLDRRIVAHSAGARDAQHNQFNPTAQALGLSLVAATTLPALLYVAARMLESSPAATQYTRAVAHGLWATALLWGSLAIPHKLLMNEGVAQAHCQWPRVACTRLRRHLRWWGGAAALTTFLMFVSESRGDEAMRESVARVVFLLLMIATAVFSHLALRERGSMSEILRMRRSRTIPLTTRRLVHALLTTAPFLLAAAAGLGFYWTALQLAIRLHMTLCLLFGILLSSDLLHRWAAIAQRNVKEAREAEAREVEVTRTSVLPAGGMADETVRPSGVAGTLDLTAVSEQTRRLTASLLTVGSVVGLGGIWADLLPAAGILRQVELWRVQKHVDPDTAKSAAAQALDQAEWVPITLADLGVALLIGAVCWVLLRNLPGLLEVTLFRRLHAGERYAFATILKYAIAVTGLTFGLEVLGISWASLQWLVAAVGLGLGFGLQEIFANFVSGILILIERPIRVGDVVTVGDVSGTVTRIHIRATWITAFDRKELIVPNKEFVTSQLVNWSLSDPILRVTVPVGVAYGSNVELAISELHRVADENMLVLSDPAPQVLFLQFGDSSLNMELRAFVAESGHALRAIHELHVAIAAAFPAAGLEIPFPQRDLHLKDLPRPPRKPDEKRGPEPPEAESPPEASPA